MARAPLARGKAGIHQRCLTTPTIESGRNSTTMLKGPGSRNLIRRLSPGVRSEEHHGADSTFVKAVRQSVNRMPNSGSQQLRLRYQDENWLVSLWRWIVEHRKEGTDWSAIRRVLQSCLDEVDARMESERAAISDLTPDAFAAVDLREAAAGHEEDVASRVALHRRTPESWRAVGDFCNRQIEELRAKGRVARQIAMRFSQGSAR